MRTLEASGKSIDEAIFNGLRELELSIDEVEIEIVRQESKGVLGIGSKTALVRLIEREPEDIKIPDYVENGGMPRRDRPERRDGKRDGRERGPRGDRRGGERRDGRRDGRERRDDRHESMPERPRIEYTLEAAEGEEAVVFLRELLSRMGIEAQLLANKSEDGLRIRIDTPAMGILIGHRGETLDALQYLTSLCVNRSRKEDGYVRITLDTEDYRVKREETLIRLARRIASQVRSSGRPKSLEPMNPYERRVLHSTLQNNPYVTTFSEGEEPNRRVVIAPRQSEGRPDNRM